MRLRCSPELAGHMQVLLFSCDAPAFNFPWNH
jgi:hypothetical protein